MKRFMFLAAALSIGFASMFAEDRTLSTYSLEIDGVTYTITGPSDEFIEYADLDSPQQERKTKRHGTSTSTSKSVSTSNGRTTTISSAVSGNTDVPKAVSDLATYQFISDKYKRMPGCRLTIIDNSATHYRSIRVTDNKEIVEKIRTAVEKDMGKATSMTQTYDEDKDNIIIQFDNKFTVGYTEYVNDNGCELFISYF